MCRVIYLNMITMKNSILILFLFSTLLSCKVSPETKFKKDGVSFTCPQSWKITDKENYFNYGYLVSIEKDGFSSSGLMSLVWFIEENQDLVENLKSYQNDLSDSFIYKKAHIEFSEVYDEVFNQIKGKAVNFTCKLLGVDHEGIIYSFNKGGMNFTILQQSATQDMKDNAEGFSQLEESFKAVQLSKT